MVLLIVCHHPVQTGGRWHCDCMGGGLSWEVPLTKFGGHKHCGSGDIKVQTFKNFFLKKMRKQMIKTKLPNQTTATYCNWIKNVGYCFFNLRGFDFFLLFKHFVTRRKIFFSFILPCTDKCIKWIRFISIKSSGSQFNNY